LTPDDLNGVSVGATENDPTLLPENYDEGVDPVDIPNPAPTGVTGNVVTHVNNDLGYTIRKTSQFGFLKEEIIVHAHQGPKTWAWDLIPGTGAAPVKQADGSVTFGNGNRVDALKIFNADGERILETMEWDLDGNRLSLTLDDTALALPYTIDPTILYQQVLYPSHFCKGQATLSTCAALGLAPDAEALKGPLGAGASTTTNTRIAYTGTAPLSRGIVSGSTTGSLTAHNLANDSFPVGTKGDAGWLNVGVSGTGTAALPSAQAQLWLAVSSSVVEANVQYRVEARLWRVQRDSNGIITQATPVTDVGSTPLTTGLNGGALKEIGPAVLTAVPSFNDRLFQPGDDLLLLTNLIVESRSVTGNNSVNIRLHSSSGSPRTQIDFAAPPAPPLLTLTPSINGQDATFTWVNNGGAIERTLCSLDGAPFTPCASGITYTGLAGGNHSFTVRAENSNISGTDSTNGLNTYSWTIATAPVNLTPPALNGSTEAGSVLTLDPGTWSNSPTLTYQWQRCDATGNNCVDVPGATSLTYTTSPADLGSTLRATVEATTPGGNATATTDPTAEIVDTTGPNLVVNDTSISEVSGVVNITGQVTDLSGVSSATLCIDGPSGNNCVNLAVDGSGNFTYPWDTTGLLNGTYNLSVLASDNLGNSVTYNWSTEVNNPVPTVSITQPTDNQQFATSGDAVALFTATDATSVSCVVRAGSASGSILLQNANCTSPFSMTSLALSSQNRVLIVTATSPAGTATSSVNFRVGQAPVINITNGPAEGSELRNNVANFNFTLTGATSATCQLNSLPSGSCSSFFSTANSRTHPTIAGTLGNYLGIGTHTVRISASNAVGFTQVVRTFTVPYSPLVSSNTATQPGYQQFDYYGAGTGNYPQGYKTQIGRELIEELPDGDLLMLGNYSDERFTSASTVVRERGVLIYRVNDDLTMDTSFGTNGMIRIPTGNGDVNAFYENGKIYVTDASFQTTFSTVTIKRYNTDGSQDAAFGTITATSPTQTVNYYTLRGVHEDASGRIWVLGALRNVTGATQDYHGMAMRIVDNAGTYELDSSFANNGQLFITPVAVAGCSGSQNWKRHQFFELGQQSSGKWVLMGSSDGGQVCGDKTVVYRINDNGSVDTTFGGQGLGRNNLSNAGAPNIASPVQYMEIMPDDKILTITGQFGPVFSRLNADGTPDNTVNPSASSTQRFYKTPLSNFTYLGVTEAIKVADGYIVTGQGSSSWTQAPIGSKFWAGKLTLTGDLDTGFGKDNDGNGTKDGWFNVQSNTFPVGVSVSGTPTANLVSAALRNNGDLLMVGSHHAGQNNGSQIWLRGFDFNAPVNTVAPVISGTVQVGNTLSVDTGTWSGSVNDYSYRWLRDGLPISGASNAGYTVVGADVGTQLSVVVTANTQSTSAAVAVDASSVVPPELAPVNTALPSISGGIKVTNTLTANNGSWNNLPASYSYVWLRNGSPIAGATSQVYQLAAADEGQLISVSVTGTNTGGSATATSTEVGPIEEAPPAAAVTSMTRDGDYLVIQGSNLSGVTNLQIREDMCLGGYNSINNMISWGYLMPGAVTQADTEIRINMQPLAGWCSGFFSISAFRYTDGSIGQVEFIAPSPVMW
jgi:uncharacterized delta-60 repeat protein